MNTTLQKVIKQNALFMDDKVYVVFIKQSKPSLYPLCSLHFTLPLVYVIVSCSMTVNTNK